VKVNKNSSTKKILSNVSGICKSNEISAILGPSGSGKTSLLNIMARRISERSTNNLTGSLKANDLEYSYT